MMCLVYFLTYCVTQTNNRNKPRLLPQDAFLSIQYAFDRGFTPDPAELAYSALPDDPLPGFREPYFYF